MSDVFRERITQPEPEPVAEPIKEEGEELNPDDKPLKDKGDTIVDLEVWEGENKKKYVNEYFGTHNISHEFMVKMPTAEIDKFVRSEMERKGFEMTLANYHLVIGELEDAIGSKNLQLLKRFKNLTTYIRWLNKKRAAEEKIKLYTTKFD